MKRKFLLLLACMFVPFLMVGCKKEQPALSAPQNLSVDNGVIVFNAVDGAQYYTIIMDDITLDIYTDNAKVKVVGDVIKYDANELLSITESYSVKVKACSKSRKHSNYTDNVEYKHIKKLEDPTNFKINGTTITWDVVDHASSYILKVVMPQNSVLVDSKGNELNKEHADSIEKADLNTFKLKTNSFNFASLISEAGKYEFYVKAENDNTEYYLNTGFVVGETYIHFIQLETPVNISLDKSGDDLHLKTVVDSNANQIIIESGQFVSEVDLESENVVKTENVVDINLTKAFKNVVVNGENLKLSAVGLFEFKTTVSCKKDEATYYTDSEESEKISYTHKAYLSTPVNLTLEFSETNNAYVASWNKVEEYAEQIRGYKLVVARSSGVEEYCVGADISNCQIGDDVVAVAVKSLGVTNYEDSKLSNFVSNLNNTLNIAGFNVTSSNNVLSWSDVADYYIVEVGENYFATSNSNYTISNEDVKNKTYTAKVVAIKNGYKANTKVLGMTYNEKLDVPIFTTKTSKAGSYKLEITPVENAIGYYVYLASANKNTYTKIERLFTEAMIELNSYVSTFGEESSYKVKVQAVASEYGKYLDSELSSEVNLSSSNQLEMPSFYKVSEQDVPIIKIGEKYYLRFNGVEHATGYDVLVNYNLKSYGLVDGVYHIDVTNYLKTAGDYVIMIRATASSSSGYISSEYNTYTYKFAQQLTEVKNIKINQDNSVYTLVFDLVENATNYRVRIEKVGDENYNSYLAKKNLSSQFTIDGYADISKYLEQSGTYNIYLTALNTANTNYIESIESSTCGTITK